MGRIHRKTATAVRILENTTFKEELNKLRFLGTRKRMLNKVYEKNIKIFEKLVQKNKEINCFPNTVSKTRHSLN